MPLSFTWKDKNSADDFGIIVQHLPQHSAPKRKHMSYQIPGRGGDLTVLERGHEIITKTVDCLVSVDADFDDLYAWLQGSGVAMFSNKEDRAYHARITEPIEPSLWAPTLKKFTVEFQCQPYSYEADPVDDTVLTESPGAITNPGTVEAEPVITVVGEGNITLNIGNQVIYLTGIDPEITINSEQMNAYYGTIPLNSAMSGAFPVLPVGETEISWTGTVTSMTIRPNWRWLG